MSSHISFGHFFQISGNETKGSTRRKDGGDEETKKKRKQQKRKKRKKDKLMTQLAEIETELVNKYVS